MAQAKKLSEALSELSNDSSISGDERIVVSDTDGKARTIPAKQLFASAQVNVFGSYSTWSDCQTALNGMATESSKSGRYVVKVGGVPYYVTLVLGASGVYWQMIEGGIVVKSDGTLGTDTTHYCTFVSRYYENGAWSAWTESAKKSDIPKPQSGTDGYKEVYIYSHKSDKTLQALSAVFNVHQYNGRIRITHKQWGSTSDYGDGKYYSADFPTASTSADGAMSKDYVSRLNNTTFGEANSTTDKVAINYPNYASGGNKTMFITAATSAKAGVMTVDHVKQLNDLTEAISELNTDRYYGVEFDVTVSSPKCTRIGLTNLHKTLPIHNRMRGCLLDDDGKVVEYLDTNDWTGNVRDGSRGQVMVEIPLHYRKFETDGDKRRVLISEYPLTGYDVVPLSYVSAYEASVQRSTNKLCSVVNTDADYRGGGNQSEYDAQSNTLLGRPATSISRTNFRNYARKRKADSTEWNCMTYDLQKTLYWLFVIEYATLNSQEAYNSKPTSEGFKQGGLGAGVTTLNWSRWSAFNGLNPIIPCGYTDKLGNRTGVVEYTMPTEYNATETKVSVPRYRGVENPFGHICKWTDGVNVQISAIKANGGDELSKVFVCHDPAKFSDTGYNGYSHVGNEARNDGYIKEVIFGVGGEVVPKVCTGGGSTTYFCDYHYTGIPTSGSSLRGLLFGGYASYGADAGFAFAASNNAPSNTNENFGSRLCFIPRTREE